MSSLLCHKYLERGKNIILIYLSVCRRVCMWHSSHVEVRRQTPGRRTSLFLPCVSWGLAINYRPQLCCGSSSLASFHSLWPYQVVSAGAYACPCIISSSFVVQRHDNQNTAHRGFLRYTSIS